MSFLTVPNLVTRAGKGAALTAAEHDANLTTLKNFSNSLATLMGVALETDGSLKANTVEEEDIQNRQIGQNKLKLTALPFLVDTGTANNFVIANNPVITAYENGMIFFVRALNQNTGPSVLKVDALDSWPVKKQGGLELESGDIKARQVFAVAYYDSVFQLISGVGSSSADDSSGNIIDDTGNLQGVIYNASAALDNAAPVSFTHGLNAVPDSCNVYLECVTADGGYTTGDLIPIGQLTDNNATFVPVFRVEVNSSKVIVTQDATTAYDNVGGSALDVLTDAAWKIRVRATREFSPSLNLQPAVTFQVARVSGAISYGQHIYALSSGYIGTEKNRLLRIDTQTNNVELVEDAPLGRIRSHFSMFRDGSNVDMLAWTSRLGIWYTTLQKPSGAWTVSPFIATGDYEYYKLLDLTGATTTATVFLGPQWNASATVGNYIIRKYILPSVTIIPQTEIDFLDSGISDVATLAGLTVSGANVSSLTYNSVKRRIYLTDLDSGMMHIFTLDVALNAWLTNDSSGTPLDYTKLHYEKSIIVGGGVGGTIPTLGNAAQSEDIAVEFDLGTGAETAIVLSQSSYNSYSYGGTRYDAPGYVTRIPWRE